MIDLYVWTTPNGYKPLMFLEETDLDYHLVPVNISKGDRFKPEGPAVRSVGCDGQVNPTVRSLQRGRSVEMEASPSTML